MAIWGTDCGRVTMSGKMISKVTASNGSESKLYKDILDHINNSSSEDVKFLRESFRDWSNDIVGDVDNKKHLALAIYAKTTSKNFKKWFGDSKVVDENGEPLLVFHSTIRPFHTFDSSKTTMFTSELGEGIYFSTGKHADEWAKYQEESKYKITEGDTLNQAQKMPLFIKSDKPWIVKDDSAFLIMQESENWPEHDAIIEIKGDKTNIVQGVVRKPNQIKSLFNEGTYQFNTGEFKENWQVEDFNNIKDFGEKTLAISKRATELRNKGADVRVDSNGIRYKADPDNIYFQAGDIEASVASEVTVDKWKDWFKRIGVDYDGLVKGIYNNKGEILNATESVDVLNRVVKIVSDKENVAIGEAGMHIVTRMIKQQDTKLFKEMMNKIDQYQLYADTLSVYKNYKEYQLEDGKPNIPKIKEEVIGKVLNEYYIQQEESITEKPELLKQVQQAQTWWQRIKETLVNFIKGNPFTEAIDTFNKGVYEKKDAQAKVNKLEDITEDQNFNKFAKNTIENFTDAVKNLPDKTAIVTHGTVVSALKTWKESGYEDIDKKQFEEQIIDNGHIEEMKVDGKTIYLVRHGESEANVLDIESTPETPLTAKGKLDALKVAQELKDKEITRVISTGTKRTKDTGEAIRNKLGLKPDIFYSEANEQRVNASLKSVDVSRTPKAIQEWNKLQKGNISFDQFLNNSQFPKEQKELLKDIYDNENPKTIADLITGLMSKYSYTVEINTAKTAGSTDRVTGEEVQVDGKWFRKVRGQWMDSSNGYENEVPATEEQIRKIRSLEQTTPTDHYANLTVPGGTNYTENEIATPGITPSIKGHAQFSTDNGIGWFRSDDKVDKGIVDFYSFTEPEIKELIESGQYTRKDLELRAVNESKSRHKGSIATKTRRILEVQSDLFQKGRDKEQLVKGEKDLDIRDIHQDVDNFYFNGDGYQRHMPESPEDMEFAPKGIPTKNGNVISEIEFERAYNAVTKAPDVFNSKNQFLQLLNKDGNWVSFFIKSIVQDSAKKGYEKVLFPTGDTASKVEGHQTLEDFKKQKEDRIKELNNKLDTLNNLKPNEDGSPVNFKLGNSEETFYYKKGGFGDAIKKYKEPFNNEIHQLQEELKRVETEGFAALKPIYDFYENRVKNILDKVYGKNNVIRITDEYGNEWNEVSIKAERDRADIFFQIPNQEKGKKLFDRFNEQSNIELRKTASGDSDYYVKEDGKEYKVWERVSKYVKEVYERRFGKRQETEKDKVDKETGTRLHGYMEDITNRLIDKSTGFRKESIDPAKGTILSGEEHIYAQLEDYLSQTLNNRIKYPDGYRFKTEQILYQPGSRPGKNDLAGTVDFLGISPTGAIHNKDWKFMNEKAWDDISAVTQKAHRTQLDLYGSMLRKTYGVKEILESNTIPFKLVYGIGTEKNVLKDVKVGDPDFTKINDKTLLPVVSGQVDIIGADGKVDPKMTAVIRKLNDLAESIYETKVSAKEQRAQDKAYQDMTYAIRTAQLSKSYDALTTLALNMVRSHIDNINKLNKFINEQTPEEKKQAIKSAQEAGDLLENIINIQKGIDVFKDLNVVMHDYIKDMQPDQKEKLQEALAKVSNNIKYASDMFYSPLTGKGMFSDAINKIGDIVGIYNISSLDRQLDLLQRNFSTAASAPFKTSQTLYKYTSRAEQIIALEAVDLDKERQAIDKDLVAWMGGSWDKKKILNAIFKEGRVRGGLVNKNAKEFYEGLKTAKETSDYEWISKHIDVAAYTENYKERLKKITDDAENTVFDVMSFNEDPTKRAGTLDQERREKSIESYKDIYDLDKGVSPKNNYLIGYANENAWSKEYKELKNPANKAAFDLYNYVVKLNIRAHEAGMLGDHYYHLFPQIRNRSINAALEGAFKSAGKNLLSDFVTEVGQERYRDRLTGEVAYSIRGRYNHDLGDDAQVSDDIMESLVKYSKDIVSFEKRSELEGLANALETYEKNKKVRVYDKGRLVKRSTGELVGATNAKNFEYLQRQKNYWLYGEKYPGEELGFKTEIGGEEKFVSYQKSLDTFVRAFTLKALGVNIGPALSNLFGGTANAFINSGKHFSTTDLITAYKDVTSTKFYTEDGKKFLSLVNHFVPFTEQIEQHLGLHASKEKIVRWLSGEGLMVFMRKSEDVIQMANAAAYFHNTMIENGKLVNIREYVKNKFNYGNIYNKPEAEQKKIKAEVEKEIENLQKTRNLFNDNNIQYDKDTFGINWGVNRLDESELTLRQQIQQFTADCVGNRPPGEIAHINMFLGGSALSNFRGWIPRLAEKRFGEYKYHVGKGTYEVGTARMLMDVITDHTQYKLKNLVNSLSYANFGKDELNIVGVAKRQYQRRLAEAREIEGTEDTMFSKSITESEFVDSYLRGVKAQVRELQAMLALNGAFYACLSWAKSVQKDDDNYAERGLARYAARMMDKFSDELGFFYSYGSFSSIIGGGGQAHPLPITSTLSDAGKFLLDMRDKSVYLISGDSEQAEKIHLAKYPINYTPVLNQFSQMLSMTNQDWNDYIYGVSHGKTMKYGIFTK